MPIRFFFFFRLNYFGFSCWLVWLGLALSSWVWFGLFLFILASSGWFESVFVLLGLNGLVPFHLIRFGSGSFRFVSFYLVRFGLTWFVFVEVVWLGLMRL